MADRARHGRAECGKTCNLGHDGQGQVEESHKEKAGQPKTDWTMALKPTSWWWSLLGNKQRGAADSVIDLGNDFLWSNKVFEKEVISHSNIWI